MKAFNSQTRSENISKMSSTHYDVFVIGGGISGAGVVRDAASRGMTVGLAEAGDFACGTSSRSSKLIHGGIRYLENLEFGLVFEALSERRKLFEMAPHLVHPLRFMIPLFEGDRVGLFKMGLGMWLYDALAMFEMPQMHELLFKESTLERLPWLKQKGLKGSFEYSDAYMDDDRLVIETLRSANNYGAHCANYLSVLDGVVGEDGKLTGLVLKDNLTGKEFNVSASHIVSTVGPWTDLVCEKLIPGWRPVMRPSKGIHLTLSRDRFPLSRAVVMAASKEKRIIFGIPRHEMVIIGTTDTDFSADPGGVSTDLGDVEYLLKIVNEYFPKAQLTVKDLIGSYSGVRPLVDDGSSTESGTSREHVVMSFPQRSITVLSGGKYTTYRHMAEETVDRVLCQFPIEERVKYGRSRTEESLNEYVSEDKLIRAKLLVDEWSKEFSLKHEETQFLVDRYGFEAEKIFESFGEKLDPRSSVRWQLEAMQAIEHTMCLNLEDFYLRRTPLMLAYPDHGREHLSSLVELFSHKLDWNAAQIGKSEEAITNHIQNEMSWKSSF